MKAPDAFRVFVDKRHNDIEGDEADALYTAAIEASGMLKERDDMQGTIDSLREFNNASRELNGTLESRIRDLEAALEEAINLPQSRLLVAPAELIAIKGRWHRLLAKEKP